MKRRTLARVSLLFLFPAALHADPVADENARLRQQVQDLQARNAALQRACPAAAQVAPAAPAVAAPASVATAASPAPAAPAAPAAPEVHHPLQLFGSSAPAAASAAAADAPPSPPDYSSTGCDRGFFSGPAAGKWQKGKAWKALHPGMSQDQVEALLGVEHYNVSEPNSSALHWQYGRCNSGYDGEVVFVNGHVTSITAPD